MPSDPSRTAPLFPALAGLAALAAALGIGRFAYTPILPAMLQAGVLDAAEAGFLASANFAGYLAGALAAAAPRLPGGRRAWLRLALALSVATTAAMGATESVAAFAALRFAGGVASAFVLVLATAAVLDRLAAAGRSSLSALHFAGVGAGIAASALTLLPVLAGRLPWPAQWGAVGIVAFALALPAWWWLPPDAAPAAAQGAPAVAPRALPPALRRWILAYGLFGFGYVITATFLVAMVRADAALRAVEPLVWLVVGLAAIPSVLLWSRASRRIGAATAFACAAALEAAGVAASVLWPGAVGALLAAALLGGTFMGLTALGMAAARAEAGADARRALALMTAAFGLGQIVGPAVAGLLHARSGDFTLASLLAAAALLVAAAVVPRRMTTNQSGRGFVSG